MTNAGWQYEIDTGTLSCEDAKLLLRALRPENAPQLTGTDELAPFALHEWASYRLVTEAGRADRLATSINRHPVDKDPDGPFWAFDFQNQIGKGTIEATLDGYPLPPLILEVLSNKFPTPASHLAFYRSLLDDLVKQNARLPFTFDAPTGHAVEETPQAPSPLFVYHFLRQHHLALSDALETVLHAPHRLLHEAEAIVPMALADTVDSEVIDWILAHAQEWVRAPHVPVARYLQGYAPARVWQRRAEETFDTAPNRFVRHFVHGLAQWLAHRELARFSDQLSAVRGVVEETQRAPLFEQVEDMRRFPTESQVLLKRDGYRELLQLWRLFHLARRPFFGPLQEAIDSRDIATLYEFWCFFALADRLQGVLGSATLTLRVTDLYGLQYRAEARFSHSPLRLVYNQDFQQCPGRTGSYSVRLRPDYTLVQGRKAVLVFDAKFRFDARDLGVPEDTYDEDVASGDIMRVVKRADLYKMHTYRDALGARAAVALYPGDEAIFYDANTHKQDTISLDELLGSGQRAGVGALPFSPRG
jgi:predicted component of viral defense system (DUF524 family)